jgi:hypothetical protein
MKKLKSINGIPLKYIRSILKIDSKSPSGLTWLPREDGQFNFDNKSAGCKHTSQKKYQSWGLSINYNGKRKSLLVSRIIFLLHNKYLTKEKCIDHIDNNSLNNSIENLREGTISQNNMNSKRSKINTSGHKGVFWHKSSGKWQVRIRLNGKEHYFGLYANKEDAIKVAIAARKKLHGEFGRIK